MTSIRTFLFSLALVATLSGMARADMSSAFLDAVSGGDTSMVGDLLAKGADVNSRGDGGMTGLMQAATGGNLDLVKLLVEKGATLDLKNDLGATAMDLAMKAGKQKVAEYLLQQAGAGVGDLLKGATGG